MPRGGKPGALGHAGRASRRIFALALAFVLQIASCTILPGAQVALAATVHITESGSGAWVEYLDANGNEVGVSGQGGSHHQADRYTDSSGNTYRCIEPHIMFMEGDYTQGDIHSMLTDRAIERCALACYWVQHNVNVDHSGVVEQVLIWKVLQQEGLVTDYLHNGTVDFGMRGYDTARAYSDFNAWYEENHNNFRTSGTMWTSGYMQKLARFEAESVSGKASVKKVSSNEELTSGNSCYSVAGARFSLWKDKSCTEAMGSEYDLVTDANGVSNEVELPLGTYWVREEEAPTGFVLDTTPHKIEVKTGENQITLRDAPITETPGVWATKYDIEIEQAQGDATLEGAQFTVRFYGGSYSRVSSLPSRPLRTWVLRCDASGLIVPSNESKVGGDEFYLNAAGDVVLPLGTITVQETKAPSGYFLEGQDATSPSGYEAPIHLVQITGDESYEAPGIGEQVKRGGVRLGKIDAERNHAIPQGDATLEGAVFAITLASERPVLVDGTIYSTGQVVKRIVTDATGKAATGDHDLPFGSYEVYEESAPAGYMVNTDFLESFTVRSDGQVVNLGGDACQDKVIRGGVAVGKVSRETSDHLSQGEAQLSGATFQVTLESEQPVVVDGTLHAMGEVVCTLVTDENGYASTPERALPYGTYTVREVEAPAGFLVNDDWYLSFSVREDGIIYDFSDTGSSVDDQVMRGGFSLNKVSEASMERLSFAVFRITSTTTGESHIAVADENGLLSTETYAHSAHTNINDAAVDEEGVVTEEYIAPAAGIWFSGRTDVETTPDDQRGALPYDVYRIEELRSSANEGMKLVAFTVRIHSDGYVPDMGTVDNKEEVKPSIGTTLTYREGLHLAPATADITLSDTVAYQNIEVGDSYTMVGELVYAPDGDPVLGPDGEPLKTSVDFVPTSMAGTVNMDFSLDASELGGRTVVAIERLEHNGEVVCTHADLEDEGQTVHIPSIGTTLTDAEGTHEVPSSEQVTLVDTVSYENLIPGTYYEITGTLMDKSTGEELCDASGQPLRATTSFYPEEASGTTTVSFVFDRSVAAGKEIVAFESLKRSGLGLAVHADIEDEAQMVTIPRIRTRLETNADPESMRQSGTIELTDTVSFEGLVVGETYELTGTLMDKETGEALVDGDGKPITATSSFTAEESVGTTTVAFSFDASLLEDRTLVAFESLQHEGREVAVHANLDDEAQTVRFPRIGTTLAGHENTHEVGPATQQTLVDTVAYHGLTPGATYVVEGTLMDKSTGNPLADASGNAITARVDFVPVASSGTVDVGFTVDTSALAGSVLVAFERVYALEGEEQTVVAAHEDLDDEGQTITVPRIATTATNAEDGSHTISHEGTVKIKDVVEYHNLRPGFSYVMVGTLVNKSTGEALLNGKKKPVQVKKEFTPKEDSGTVELEFSFDVSKFTGDGVVVFESCQRDGYEVASHADLGDEGQTVNVERPQKKPETDTPHSNTTSSNAGSNRQATPRTGDETVSPVAVVVGGVLTLGVGVARIAYVSYRRR